MFAGHYAPALALRARFREAPLWALFVAVQAVDIAFFVFVPLGVERMQLDPSQPGFLALRLIYMPWTHSLALSALYGLLVFGLFAALRRPRLGIALGIAVFSHWVCDLLVHTPDLPLAPGASSVGLGLWRHREIAFALEVLLVLGGLAVLWPRLAPRARVPAAIVCAALVLAQVLSTFVLPVPSTTLELAISSQVSYLIFALLAFWVDRRDRKRV